jgi:hypothetical protein
MGSFRSLKTKQLAPGIRLNLNKRSGGVTFGPRGARYTVNTSGRRTTSVGIPGTGLWYRTQKGGTRRKVIRDAETAGGYAVVDHEVGLPSEDELRAEYLYDDEALAAPAELEQRPDEEVYAELAHESETLRLNDPEMHAHLLAMMETADRAKLEDAVLSYRAELTSSSGSASVVDVMPTGRWLQTVVVLAGLLSAVSFVRYGLTVRALTGAVFMSALTLLAVIDLAHDLVPNRIVYPSALLTVLLVAAGAPSHLGSHIIAGLGFAAVVLVIVLLRPADLGAGYVKLALLLGLALGGGTIAAASLSFVAAAAYALLSRASGASWNSTFSLAPFFALAGCVIFLASGW